MWGVTGLEPAASGVTGRRSNQLSYTPEDAQSMIGVLTCFWRGTTQKMRSNNRKAEKYQPRPMPPITPTLKLFQRTMSGSRLQGRRRKFVEKLVGSEGLEPRPTRCKRVALPAELTTQVDLSYADKNNAEPYRGPALKKIAKINRSQRLLEAPQL